MTTNVELSHFLNNLYINIDTKKLILHFDFYFPKIFVYYISQKYPHQSNCFILSPPLIFKDGCP